MSPTRSARDAAGSLPSHPPESCYWCGYPAPMSDFLMRDTRLLEERMLIRTGNPPAHRADRRPTGRAGQPRAFRHGAGHEEGRALRRHPWNGQEAEFLLKPGAEKLGFLFRLAPRYEISMSNMERGHREYRVICSLHHMPTENYSGAGVGTSSTTWRRTPYRYRTCPPLTEHGFRRSVPAPAYWNERGYRRE